MEEKETKVVNMSENKSGNMPDKMSYEQLENIAHQLSEQTRQLHQRLQEANLANMFQRLNYLFKVIENKDTFPEEFVHNCVTEVVDIMTIPDEENKDK
jgi:chromosome condensin MukBEF complex kleisin-like MukF subunit